MYVHLLVGTGNLCVRVGGFDGGFMGFQSLLVYQLLSLKGHVVLLTAMIFDLLYHLDCGI